MFVISYTILTQMCNKLINF